MQLQNISPGRRAVLGGSLRSMVLATATTICVTLPCVAARAQDSSPAQWHFFITPYLWISGVGGTLKTPNPYIPDQEVEANFGDVLSHLNGVPIMGSAEARYGRFGVLADIIVVSVKSDIETRGVLFGGGNAELTQVIGSALGTYRVVDSARQSLDVGIGVRAFGLSTTFTVDPGLLRGFEKSPGQIWANAIAGVRYRLNVSGRWGLTAYADGGGGPDASVTWQAMATVDYRVGQSTTLRAGYRHLQFDYEGNRLHQNMSMSGPIVGATFQF